MVDQQYSLQSLIDFVFPWNLVCAPSYLINPRHGDIAVADQQYQNNLHDYHLVNNMNIFLKKIVVAAINNQWLKGANDLILEYANKTFLELMYWLYIHYRQIYPGDLMKNRDMMQTLYHVEEPIEILFNHIETGQEFSIAGNLPFSNRQLA